MNALQPVRGLPHKVPDGYSAENEGLAGSVPEGQASGVCRDGTIGERSEKDAGFDEDGTKLMPYLRQIHKMGHLVSREKLAGEYGNQDIEDLDAGYQSFFNQPVTHRKTESDVSSRGSGEGTGSPGDLPITDTGDGEEDAPKHKIGHLKTAYDLQGQTDFQGLPIAIENKAGTVRSGTDPDGHEWHTKMLLSYGYIKGTKGADGEGVDVYVGPDKDADSAFVVQQKDPSTGEYDEDKVMLGLGSKKDAKEAFMAHYDDPDAFLGPIKEVPMDRLKELVASKERLVKISFVMCESFADELRKIAFDPVMGMGPEPAAQQPAAQSPFGELRASLSDTRRTVNLARKLWEARSAVPMLL